MDQISPLHPAYSPAAADIVWLQCRAPARGESVQQAQGFARLQGPDGDDLICEVLENIAAWLDLVQTRAALGRDGGVITACDHIAGIALHCGLGELQRAARHVAQCAAGGDRIALAATMARLERSFDAAVVAIWDLRAL